MLPELDRGVTVLPWDLRHGLYFADVELVISTGTHSLTVAGSGVAGSAATATARCYSEFYERWCQLNWQLAGRSLTSYDLLTGEPAGVLEPPRGGRPDSTGSCAHGRGFERDALLHGLLEVVERDAVVRLLDRRLGHTVRVPPDAGPAVTRTAGRWGVVLRCYAIAGLWSTAHAYTVVAVARGARHGGALGAASHFRLDLATEAACQQALMMYTTALHQRRRAEPAGFADLVRTADHIDDILAELDDAGSAGALPAVLTGATVGDLAEGVRQVFGQPPRYLRYHPYGLAVGDRVSLRVAVDGALDPRCVTRTPWPVG